jgi:hypothetical protein
LKALKPTMIEKLGAHGFNVPEPSGQGFVIMAEKLSARSLHQAIQRWLGTPGTDRPGI